MKYRLTSSVPDFILHHNRIDVKNYFVGIFTMRVGEQTKPLTVEYYTTIPSVNQVFFQGNLSDLKTKTPCFAHGVFSGCYSAFSRLAMTSFDTKSGACS